MLALRVTCCRLCAQPVIITPCDVLCCAMLLWPSLQASSAYKHSLKEVLALPAIASKIKDTKAAREVSALQEFYTMLTADSSRAFYGPGHVLAAAELGAIQTLLISGAWEAAALGQSVSQSVIAIECTVRRDPKMPSRAGASPRTQCSLLTSDIVQAACSMPVSACALYSAPDALSPCGNGVQPDVLKRFCLGFGTLHESGTQDPALE